LLLNHHSPPPLYTLSLHDALPISLVGIDLDTKPGLYRMTIGTQVRLLRVLEKKFEVRRLRVAEEFVNPPASAMEQIARDNKKTADRKSTRLNSSHVSISYAVFCLK